MIAAFANNLSCMGSMQRLGVATIGGALTALALPPFHLVPILWISLPVFLWLLESEKELKGAAFTGWAFGFGFFLAGFHWIANAFFVDKDTFGTLAIPSVVALSAGFGLYISLIALVLHKFRRPASDDPPIEWHRFRLAWVLAFAALWTFMEWLRGWLFTGFPWNLMATVWAPWPAMGQVCAFIGSYGLSWLTVLASAAPTLLATRETIRVRVVIAVLPVLVLMLMAGIGLVRLYSSDTESAGAIVVRLIQPNIVQVDKWRRELLEHHLFEHVRMSRSNGFEEVDVVIWAETAVPFSIETSKHYRQVVTQAVPSGGILVTGAHRTDQTAGNSLQVYNSLFVLGDNGVILDKYDKTHLVPFGEYIPFRKWLPLSPLTSGMGFSAGPGPQTISISGIPAFSPLICYESIFPSAVTGTTRPKWLLNVTNDAWFGDSVGPHQHFAAARLRAIEEGLPLVRVANTGISAVVDSLGQVKNMLPLSSSGVIDSSLPAPLNPPTLFSRLGNSVALLLSVMSGIISLLILPRLPK